MLLCFAAARRGLSGGDAAERHAIGDPQRALHNPDGRFGFDISLHVLHHRVRFTPHLLVCYVSLPRALSSATKNIEESQVGLGNNILSFSSFISVFLKDLLNLIFFVDFFMSL